MSDVYCVSDNRRHYIWVNSTKNLWKKSKFVKFNYKTPIYPFFLNSITLQISTNILRN